LNIAVNSDGIISLLPFEGKANLESAPVLKKLNEIRGGDRA
jgi:hypothetical protein